MRRTWAVTVKEIPAVWELEVPERPVGVPGAKDSPGVRSNNLVNAAPASAVLVTVKTVSSVRSSSCSISGLTLRRRGFFILFLPVHATDNHAPQQQRG